MCRNRIVLAMLTVLLCAMPLAEAAQEMFLSPDGEQPVLTLRRQANFIEQGSRSGTLIQLFDDKSLEIYALGMLSDADEPVLMHAGIVTDEVYQTIASALFDGGFWELPEWIETGVQDGDTVALTVSTNQGCHTVSAYSPDGTPFGEMVQVIETLLGAHENVTGE